MVQHVWMVLNDASCIDATECLNTTEWFPIYDSKICALSYIQLQNTFLKGLIL